MTRKPVEAPREAHKPAARRPAKPSPRPKASKKAPSLRERRERARNRVSVLVFIVIGCIVGVVVYGFWRPEVRVSEVHATNVPDEERASALITKTISGKYFGILPRDSIFFYPEEDVHAAVLAEFPSLESVKISRDSFTALSLEGTRRTAAFYWCGESSAAFTVDTASCYEADAAGLVFAKATIASSTPGEALLKIYAPLENADALSYPVRGMVTGATYLPNLLEFVNAVKELGVPVLSTFIDGDEAELYVTPETRLMYVLGHEEEARQSAKAAFEDLNLMNGSIEYVDLRFPGRLYVKRYGESE